MAKKKIRSPDPLAELSEIMDDSEALENIVGDDSEAYEMDDTELEKLLADDDMLIPVKRSVFDVEDDESEPVEDDMDEYPDEEEDPECRCGARLLDDGLCRYCDHGGDDSD